MSDPTKTVEAITERVRNDRFSGGAAADLARPEIQPIAGQDVLAHDACLDFDAPTRYRGGIKLPPVREIGQKVFIRRRARNVCEDPKNAPRN